MIIILILIIIMIITIIIIIIIIILIKIIIIIKILIIIIIIVIITIRKINEILTDRRSSGRHQAQWLESCSTLLYVVKADERSLAHLEQFLLERRNLPARQELIFVLNQLGNSRWFRSHEKVFKETTPGAKFLLPLDHSIAERTRTQHTTLKEISPRSALRRSIGEIARHIES